MPLIAEIERRSGILVVEEDIAPVRGLLRFLMHDYTIKRVRKRWDALVPGQLRSCFAIIVGERPNDLGIKEFLERLDRSGARPPLVAVIGSKSTPWMSYVQRQTGADGLIFSDLPTTHQVRQFRLLASGALDRGIARSDAAVARIWIEAKDTVNDLTARIREGQPIPRSVVQALAVSVTESVDSGTLRDFLCLLRDHHAESVVHCLDVAITALLLGRHMGVRRRIDELRLFETGLLHDVGKLMIPVSVLQKPGPLSAQEREMVRKHPVVSERIIRQSEDYDDLVINAALRHHERLDGTGYPHGLAGDRIDDLSRLIAVCDVFCALTERRSYHAQRSPAEVVPILRDMSGRHLDPVYVEHMIEVATGGAPPS